MKRIQVTGLLLIFCSTVFAQKTDSLKYQRILLISYNPDYYLSDAEQDLMKQNKRTPDEYREYLRRALDNKLAGQLEKTLPCTSLLPDTTRRTKENTWDFYNHSGLKYTNPYGRSAKTQSGILKTATEKKEKSQHEAAAYRQLQGDVKVMDNSITDSSWLKNMAKEYAADLMVSLNQFEIKTNYNSCLDISRGIYRREVWVHYTLMESSGKKLSGDVAIASFPSNDNAVEGIAEKVFPQVAADIAGRVASLLH